MAAPSLQVPPQALEAEMAVLGSMLIQSEAVEEALNACSENDFYKDAHKAIYNAIATLYNAGVAADLVTVGEELRRRGALSDVGGVAYLSECTHKVATAAHVKHYAEIVHEKAILRELIATSTKIISECYSEREPGELLDDAQAQIMTVAQKQATTGFVEASTLAGEVLHDIEKLHQRKEAVTGVPTGFVQLDKKTSGFQKGDLILIAARPSQGKTALSLNIAGHVVLERKMPVAFFSMEMSRSAIMQRLIASEARVNLYEVRSGFFRRDRWTHLTNAAARLSESPLYIDDTPGLSVLEVRSRSRRLATELKRKGQKLQMVMIDYLQLMRGASKRVESRQQEVAEISRGLKFLARDLNVPVVALSQLSRRVEEKGRADGKPQLSDLRESGALEQDADLVAFIYREAAAKPGDPTIDESKAEIIIAKQRQGPTGSVEVRFNRDITRFENLDPEGAEPDEEPVASQDSFA
ncbi:MAG: replicative DNA helicase [Elusimicrobia bacterium]|nr:replicative DNA helicase [Elusimicrobiota bacterium]